MTKQARQDLSDYEMLCVDYDVLVLHIGHVLSPITSSLSVSHAATPSARLDYDAALPCTSLANR